jgi:hypothetical protein
VTFLTERRRARIPFKRKFTGGGCYGLIILA